MAQPQEPVVHSQTPHEVKAALEREIRARSRAVLLVNKRARRGKKFYREAKRLLEERGIALDGNYSALTASDISTRVANAIAEGHRLIVVGGGDGTLSSVLPHFVHREVVLGILPLGTANDLARTLGIPTDPEGAARVILEGATRRVDLGEVNGHPFFNVASIGLSVAVTEELTRDLKRRWGTIGYAIATIRALWRMRPFSAEIRCDGEVVRVRSLQIAVGNGRHYGGGLTVDREARIDDELLGP